MILSRDMDMYVLVHCVSSKPSRIDVVCDCDAGDDLPGLHRCQIIQYGIYVISTVTGKFVLTSSFVLD